jgi:hypothetical protein
MRAPTLSRKQILNLAAAYTHPVPGEETEVCERIGPAVRERGHLTTDEFEALAHWASPRLGGRIRLNYEDEVREATKVALSAETELMRIGALVALEGVGHPIASVVLHHCHVDAYPILDPKILVLMGVRRPPAPMRLPFWVDYVAQCRELAAWTGVDMRTLDRALWVLACTSDPEATFGIRVAIDETVDG